MFHVFGPKGPTASLRRTRDPEVRLHHRAKRPSIAHTAFLLTIGCAPLVVGCGGHAEPGEHEGHAQGRYPATTPLFTDTVVQKDYVCQIHSIQHIEVRALEKGYLQDMLVDEGQQVKEGQLMFRIRPVLYQAEVQRAQAEAEFAGIEYRNTKALADSNVVSPNELALAKARYDKALAELNAAQAHLGFTEITAPFSGIVGRFHVRKGSLLDEGELLTELSDNSEMWVYFNVPEAEYLEYRKRSLAGTGTKLTLKMANGEVFDRQGEITAIESDFNNTTGNIAFRATFPNPQGLLRHGETGSILMDSRLAGVLLIPQKATFEVLDHRYVFVVDGTDTLRSRRIEVGPELQHVFVVEEGLTKDDRFLLEGLRKVKDGDKVEVELLDPDSVMDHLGLYAE
ncbi:MAG: efflux RND transporter periplasmic adaptor subunit [Flavobacteriales bacterium]|nr:efflux RND transporter periplasmic adaptor subunit [Flavobacteriales bacterium]